MGHFHRRTTSSSDQLPATSGVKPQQQVQVIIHHREAAHARGKALCKIHGSPRTFFRRA